MEETFPGNVPSYIYIYIYIFLSSYVCRCTQAQPAVSSGIKVYYVITLLLPIPFRDTKTDVELVEDRYQILLASNLSLMLGEDIIRIQTLPLHPRQYLIHVQIGILGSQVLQRGQFRHAQDPSRPTRPRVVHVIQESHGD